MDTSSGLFQIRDNPYFHSGTYQILVGNTGYNTFQEALKQYLYTPEEATEKQEESKTPGLWDLITIVKK